MLKKCFSPDKFWNRGIRSALCWNCMQRTMTNLLPTCRDNFRSYFQGSSSPRIPSWTAWLFSLFTCV